MFVSNDSGQNLGGKFHFGKTKPSDKFILFKGKIYAQEINRTDNTFHTYQSSDLGKTWILYSAENPEEIVSTTILFSYPAYLFKSVRNVGVYREIIPPNQVQGFPFLELPWNNQNTQNVLANVSAYFDHKYPLSNYSLHQESTDFSKTTLNFLGMEESTPLLYYSSHNGTDFALPYGTEVKAASGRNRHLPLLRVLWKFN